MWAYESVFYQIYPLGFCGAPFENDGVLEHRINKVSVGFHILRNLEQMQFIFLLYSNQIHMVIIQGITACSIND